MSPNSPLRLGRPPEDPFGSAGAGGAGGAGGPPADPGAGGGGGGGAAGAPNAARAGAGGGGGGGALGMPLDPVSKPPGMVGGGGDIGPPTLGLPSLFGSSMAESGLGGAMVPNNMDANSLALPPDTFSGPSSSSEDDVESTTDHSSSSGRTRDGRLPVGVGVTDGRGCDLAASCCCASRWNGFVDSPAAGGEATGGALAVDSTG